MVLENIGAPVTRQSSQTVCPLKNRLNSEKYQVTDDEVLKRLYGLK